MTMGKTHASSDDLDLALGRACWVTAKEGWVTGALGMSESQKERQEY